MNDSLACSSPAFQLSCRPRQPQLFETLPSAIDEAEGCRREDDAAPFPDCETNVADHCDTRRTVALTFVGCAPSDCCRGLPAMRSDDEHDTARIAHGQHHIREEAPVYRNPYAYRARSVPHIAVYCPAARRRRYPARRLILSTRRRARRAAARGPERLILGDRDVTHGTVSANADAGNYSRRRYSEASATRRHTRVPNSKPMGRPTAMQPSPASSPPASVARTWWRWPSVFSNASRNGDGARSSPMRARPRRARALRSGRPAPAGTSRCGGGVRLREDGSGRWHPCR